MEFFNRSVAVFLEIILLTSLLGCLLSGAGLLLFDLGLKPKYKRAVLLALFTAGGIGVVFFIAHLGAFYPQV
jgi:hypothetical protein